MKILLTGLPATGKTCIGNYLRVHKKYEHFEVEDFIKTLPYHEWVKRLMEFIEKPGEDKVITWGIVPDRDLQCILYIKSKGYRMFWFDGPRTAVERHFLKRGGGTEQELEGAKQGLNDQLARIDASNLSSFGPFVPVNPYGPDGEFLDREEIVVQLLRPED